MILWWYLSHDSDGGLSFSLSHSVLDEVIHVLIIKQTDQVKGTKTGCAAQSQVPDYHGAEKQRAQKGNGPWWKIQTFGQNNNSNINDSYTCPELVQGLNCAFVWGNRHCSISLNILHKLILSWHIQSIMSIQTFVLLNICMKAVFILICQAMQYCDHRGKVYSRKAGLWCYMLYWDLVSAKMWFELNLQTDCLITKDLKCTLQLTVIVSTYMIMSYVPTYL